MPAFKRITLVGQLKNQQVYMKPVMTKKYRINHNDWSFFIVFIGTEFHIQDYWENYE